MELQTCRALCNDCLLRGAESQQERFALQSNQKRIQKDNAKRQVLHEKNVFSFKLQQHRSYEQSDKHTANLPTDGRNIRLKSAEIGPPAIYRLNITNSSPASRFYSPTFKEHIPTIQMPQPTTNRSTFETPTISSPRATVQPKIAFHFNTSIQTAPLNSKMMGKRLRTNEEETEYSSKHSQVLFKTSYQIPDNSSWVTFQKSKESCKEVIFQECREQSHLQSDQALQTISEKMLSSQEQSHSPIIFQQYQNGPTVHTIVTSTQIKSRHSSKFSNQIRMLREVREERVPPHLSFDVQGDQNCSITATPQAYLSPREGYALPNDPTLFEVSPRQRVSPRISVLDLSRPNQNLDEEQQELRDVIDHNFLMVSQPCSRNNSPKVSLNPSLKNVSDHEHSERQRYLSPPFHSRESSWEMGPLMSTQAKFRRTNTIQSIESFSSEMISCLDIKFMQKNRGRRGVSRLL